MMTPEMLEKELKWRLYAASSFIVDMANGAPLHVSTGYASFSFFNLDDSNHPVRAFLVTEAKEQVAELDRKLAEMGVKVD